MQCSRVAGGRRRRVRFQPPQIAPEPKHEVIAALQAPDKAGGADGHWPAEIPRHMVFSHRVTSKLERCNATKEAQFEARGPLPMFEHVFQANVEAGKLARNSDPVDDVKPSPSQSSDSGATDEPRTPADMPDTRPGVDHHANVHSRLPGGLGSWPEDQDQTLAMSPFGGSPQFSSHPCMSEDHPSSAFHTFGGRDSYADDYPSQGSYSEDVHWHHTFSTTDHTQSRVADNPAYDDRRSSFASSRELSPFDSQSNSDSSHPSIDEVRLMHLRRLPHQNQSPMLHGQYTGDTVSPSMLTGHGQFTGFHADQSPQQYSPSCQPALSDKNHDMRYRHLAEWHTREMSQGILPLHPAYSSPHLHPPRGWENGPEGSGSGARRDDHSDCNGEGPRGIPPAHYHAPHRPGEPLLQPVHTSYYSSTLPDRHYMTSETALSDRALRPPLWNAQAPPSQPLEPRFDPAPHERPPVLPVPYYPPPVYLNGPPYFQPFQTLSGGDRLSGPSALPPYRPDLERRHSWTEHFDFLQTHIKKKRRIQKDAEKAQEAKKPVYNHQCPLCERQFPRRNSLAIHLKWHYKDRDGECVSYVASWADMLR